ncbi:MAG: glycerophosphodiester phosphodiesterase [Pirellulales bacterium]|nr:glycerophosphodiester phosphodiesterase [Pirellulales bacterium]
MTRLPSAVATLVLLAAPAAPVAAQQIVAHRGASDDAPENTLAAFRLAWKQGADGIEGDFYLTADEKIVCIHDRDTRRTTGVDLPVEHSTLAQLRRLDAGRWKDAQWTGETIPTLEEVFRTVPRGKLFVIELKSKSPIVPLLKEELERLDSGQIKLLIISFDADTVAACKRALPEIPVHWLTGFERSKASGQFHPTAEEVAQTIQTSGADGVGMKGMREVIDRQFVQTLAANGCREFHVWTIDSVQDAKFFQDLGAVGITTNRPASIGRAIGEAEPVR